MNQRYRWKTALLLGFLALLSLSCTRTTSTESAPPVRPEYRLELEPDLELLTFEATLRLAFANPAEEPLREVPLHVYPLAAPSPPQVIAIREVRVGDRVVAPRIEGVVIRVPIDPPIEPGRRVDLEVAFDGVLPRIRPGEDGLLNQSMKQLEGIFSGLVGVESGSGPADYGLLAYGEGVLSFGNWYPQLPAFADGKWQLADTSPIGDMAFAEIADYRIEVRVPSDVVVAASGSLHEQTEPTPGRTRLIFDAPQARNVAVELSRDFQTLEQRVGEVTVRSLFLPGREEPGAVALETAVTALSFYSDRFGAYPWRELDVVEAPLLGGAGGVEFTGLVTCGSALYRGLDSEIAPLLEMLGAGGMGGGLLGEMGTSLDELLEFVVAHEVAHQWWNAAIGSDARKSPFLDEALANFSAVRYFAHAHGEEAAERQREMQLRLNYHAYRSMGGPDLPVGGPAASFESQLAYAAIVYGKGALFFEELVARYGDEPVLQALGRYAEATRFGVAEDHDLLAALQTIEGAEPDEVHALWERWILETHGDEDIGNPLEDLLGSTLQGLLGGDADQLEGLLEESLGLLQELLEGM